MAIEAFKTVNFRGASKLLIVQCNEVVDRYQAQGLRLTLRQYNPPPNPAKLSDSRAKEYVAKFGSSSWEVDSLEPSILSRLIVSAFGEVLDRGLMAKVIAQENEDKKALTEFAKTIVTKKEEPEGDDD
jgi:hypothetical protein